MANAIDCITLAEEHLSEICQAFGNYARKAAKYRDACDDLSITLHKFSGSDSSNDKLLKPCLQLISDSIASLADLRDNHVNSLLTGVVNKLTQFGPICKRTKSDLKHLEKSNEQPTSKMKTMLKGEDCSESRGIVDSDAGQNNSHELIEEILENFEDIKNGKLESVLIDFIKNELIYNCKTIEVLTEASKCMQNFKDSKILEISTVGINETIPSSNDTHHHVAEIMIDDSQGPGSYHHHTIIGGHNDESSYECTTESSNT